jgi:hypothetical protein
VGEENFLALVTSKAWREKLASLLLGRLSPSELEMCGEHELLGRWFFGGDHWAGFKYYMDRNKPMPGSIAKAIWNERHKPKKRGRNARKEQQAEQAAFDIACFLATEHLMKKERMKLSPACQLVGDLMSGRHCTRQAVVDARERGRGWGMQVLEV